MTFIVFIVSIVVSISEVKVMLVVVVVVVVLLVLAVLYSSCARDGARGSTLGHTAGRLWVASWASHSA